MFAEELGGNTQRRRQEEARVRRRQLKQQQDKKAQEDKAQPSAGNGTTITTTTTPVTESSASGISGTQNAAGTANAAVGSTTTDNHASTTLSLGGATADATGALLAVVATTTKIATAEPATGDIDKKPSAVAHALQQRQLRHQVQHQQKAATTLQSIYRAHRSNNKLLKQQSTLIAQRLKEISQLRVVLKQQEKGEFIPPPALVTSLLQQVLFLNKKLPYDTRRRQSPPTQGDKGAKEAPSPSPSPSSVPPLVGYQFPASTIKVRDILNDPLKLHLLLQVVILPGLNSTDENMNPFVVWMQSPQGMYRLHALLRLCLVMATMPNIDPQVLASITKFLRGVLLVQTANSSLQEKIVATCRPFVLSLSLPRSSKRMDGGTNNDSITVLSTSVAARKILCQQHAHSDVPLDLLQLVRYHLLYATGGPDPIPPEADRCREACIPPKQRAQADALLQLVVDVIHHTPSTSNPRERQNLHLRFVSEVLTIPLLTWKTSATTTSKLLAIDHQPLQSQQQAPPHQQQPTIVLISMIQTFVNSHGPTLAAGDIESVLAADTPLTACPATPTQSLLANLILLGRSTPILNGSDGRKLDFASTTLFFQFVATLVDAIPLGTFTSRESVVEWISDGKGHHSPVVLSTVVMEQCKMLLVDAFVRKLLYCAIDDDLLGTEDILKQKNDKDLKQETALQEAGTSAATLAAQEARVDRNRSFWNASSWGRKVAKLIAGGDSTNDGGTKSKAGGSLINTSSVSRKLGESGKKGRDAIQNKETEVVGQRATKESYSPELLLALCHLYGIILARWGGGGREDIIRRVKDSGPLMKKDDKGAKQEIATAKPDTCTQSLLNVLCFSTPILRTLWGLIQSDGAVISDLYAVIDPTKGNIPVRGLNIRPCYASASGVGSSATRSNNRVKNVGAAPLYVFVCALVHVLIITDDSEIHDMEKPLPLHQLRRCIQTLKQLLYRACCLDDTSSSETPGSGSHNKGLTSNYFGLALISASSRTMRDLYDRSSRRPFCVPKMWLMEGLMEKDIARCKSHGDYVALLSSPVLRVCPFLVSFKRRLLLFERIVTTNRVELQGENSPNPFHTNPLKPGIPIRITRGRILEDGLATMNNLGRNMRQRLAVQYYNEGGRREDGVDAGGLFKEFWTDLCAIAFDPNYALFRVTEGAGNCMYPSPASRAAHGSEHITLFEFLGRILGKALFEGITIRPQFAHFFLSFLRGDYNYFHMLPDLSTMDPQLHNNLMFLKNYDGDAEDLCLTFTVANDDFGGNIEVPLVPNGSDLEVTNFNKQRYIGLVAKHHVVDRVKEQSEAFTRGLWEVIDRQWLLLFNEPELQVLISGATDGKIDVEDMRQNARYIGGYTGIDRNINRFWKVVATLSSKHQADLLRFVTSCERPPPLGFASLIPPFTIQRVGILRDGDKLPTASTCFNVLKLPTYSSEKVLRDRLIYAIESGAGFELT